MSVELSVVVPIFNEEKILFATAKNLSQYLDIIVGINKWQYVLVDNGSTDSTPLIIKNICNKWPLSLHIKLPKPNIGEALKAGLENAEGLWAYIINVDWWDPVFICWAWENREKYDLIIGSKRADPYLNHHPQFRKFLSWGLNSLLQILFDFVGMETHGQKLLKMSSMKNIIETCVMRRGQFDTELTLKALKFGLWVAEVPVPIKEVRKHRNLMIKKILQNVYDLFKLKREISPIVLKESIKYHRWSRYDMLEVYCKYFGEEYNERFLSK